MLQFDHVLVAVSDLTTAAARLNDKLGLASVDGGRHSGLGTGNRIIPLGPDYIELIAVVDPGATGPLARWVASLSNGRDRPAALCLRTDDIDLTGQRLGLEVVEMQRERPDGVVLKWKLAGLGDTLADPSLPFYIEWLVGAEDHPGAARARHEAEPSGIAWVEVSGDRDEIDRRLQGADLDVRIVDGDRGVRAVGVSTTSGTLVIS